jgi:hypothetical protein
MQVYKIEVGKRAVIRVWRDANVLYSWTTRMHGELFAIDICKKKLKSVIAFLEKYSNSI